MTPIDIGNRIEPFIDNLLKDRLNGLSHELQKPMPQEIAIIHDEPWEGNTCGYHTVFQDGDQYRMYYRGSQHGSDTGKTPHEVTCYAESTDGIHWHKPNLNLFEFNGSKSNNIVWMEKGSHDFAPFKDPNPNADPNAQYKAIARGDGGLYAFQSTNGIHWVKMADHPVITEGKFDSQNLAFWDQDRGCYVDFHRGLNAQRIRDIMTCTSTDFLSWTKPTFVTHTNAPTEHLYTNQIIPYYRAPHIYVGFPMRFVPNRTVYDIAKGGISDGVFMTSRDGQTFYRWREALIRPGLLNENWICRSNMIAWGILETHSPVPDQAELSIYSTERYYSPTQCNQLRRYTLRLDGFASIHANAIDGEMVTKPFIFSGSTLHINFSTSATGGLSAELQYPDHRPIEGFTHNDCDDIFGDAISHTVTWQEKSDLSTLIGKPIRLHIKMQDADLFAIQFA